MYFITTSNSASIDKMELKTAIILHYSLIIIYTKKHRLKPVLLTNFVYRVSAVTTSPITTTA